MDGLKDVGRILVVGMGRSGVAAALAAREILPRAEVVVADKKEEPLAADAIAGLEAAGVRLFLGRDDAALLEGSGLVVKSPGVPREAPLVQAALKQGIPVWGEVEFARRYLKNVIVGVTGTNGKTTTTELVGHILAGAGVPCRVAGNVGTALSSLIGKAAPDEVLVVELSSFQLEDSIGFRPEVAVLLNLAEDHLDRHPTKADYFSAKMRIFANQGPADVAVLNRDDANISGRDIPGSAARVWVSRAGPASGEARAGGGGGESMKPQVFAPKGVIRADVRALMDAGAGVRSRLAGDGGGEAPGRKGFSGGEDSQEVIAWSEAALKGEHNLENSLAATAACLCLGLLPGEVAAGLKSFPGVRHRLQEVGVVDGVTYVNDSKATNVDAALKALTAFKGGIHLILGGSRKGCSFDRLAEAAAPDRVREVILIGEAAPDIAGSFERISRKVVMAGRLEKAVGTAAANAVPGEVVLLAPACASFDQYGNFEERGEHFISLVSGLKAGGD